VQLPNPRASGTSARSQAQAKGVDYATSVVTGEAVKQKAAAIAQDILLGPEGALQRFSGELSHFLFCCLLLSCQPLALCYPFKCRFNALPIRVLYFLVQSKSILFMPLSYSLSIFCLLLRTGFFYEPLFTPSGASREINAVDSENGKNLQQDSWRLGQLQKHTRADPRHPNFNVRTCAAVHVCGGTGAKGKGKHLDAAWCLIRLWLFARFSRSCINVGLIHASRSY
jgi:hypothetical protein